MSAERYEAFDLGIYEIVFDLSGMRFQFRCQCRYQTFDPDAWVWHVSGGMRFRTIFGEESGPPPDHVKLCDFHAEGCFRRAYWPRNGEHGEWGGHEY